MPSEDQLKIILTQEEIELKIAEIGKAISADYAGKEWF
jgi:hypoxanthine-guanine phosphoribosyltransferase